MKKIYWRPRAVSRTALTLIGMLSIVGLFLVENLLVVQERPYYAEKLAAAKLAEKAMQQIYYARQDSGTDIDFTTDPTQSGLIGLPISPVTTVTGDLSAKQTSINPNFAAVIVDMLTRAGVKEGDKVAVGASGSFPALNICVYAAIETLKLKPVVISSASASQWGANVPDLLWIDMERILREHDPPIFSIESAGSSIGGYEDRGLGLDPESLALITKGIERNHLPMIVGKTFEEIVQERMNIYESTAPRGVPIKAYINVGGGATSVGRAAGKKMFKPGLNLRPPGRVFEVDGVMPRFVNGGVPVIHLVQIEDLAEKYGLPIAPMVMPEVGPSTTPIPSAVAPEGAPPVIDTRNNVYEGEDYNRWLAGGVLIAITLSMYAFIRSDIGFRLLQTSGRRKDVGHPEPMV